MIFSKTDTIPSRSQLFPEELLSIAIRADRKWAGFLADKIGDQLIPISKLNEYIISKCISQFKINLKCILTQNTLKVTKITHDLNYDLSFYGTQTFVFGQYVVRAWDI